jgi:hypothetical protein
MREPDLTVRAQRAAVELERAWQHWRTMHHQEAEPLPPVSSFLGYSMEDPWGQPRVVFGLAASDAEQLAALLDRREGSVYAAMTSRSAPGTGAQASGAEREITSIHVPTQGGTPAPQREWAAAASPADLSNPLDPPLYRDIQRDAAWDSAVRDIASPPPDAQPFSAGLEAPAGPGEPDRAGQPGVVAFRPRHEPEPDQDSEPGPESAGSAGPAEAAPAGGWTRSGRLSGHAMPRPKRAGAGTRASNKQEGKDRAGLADIAAELAGWAASERPGQASQRRGPQSSARPDRGALG